MNVNSFEDWIKTQVNCCTSCNSAYDAGLAKGRKEGDDKLNKFAKDLADLMKKAMESFNNHG